MFLVNRGYHMASGNRVLDLTYRDTSQCVRVGQGQDVPVLEFAEAASNGEVGDPFEAIALKEEQTGIPFALN